MRFWLFSEIVTGAVYIHVDVDAVVLMCLVRIVEIVSVLDCIDMCLLYIF